MEGSCCGELGDATVSAMSCGGRRDEDPRLCLLKVTPARDGEARGGSRAAPWLSGKLDTVCSASVVCC